MSIVNAREVVYRYRETESAALDRINLRLEEGESLALIGTTGSGKSSLLQLIAGLLLPHSGSLHVAGIELSKSKLSEKELDTLRRRVGIALQRPEDMLFKTYLGDDIAFGPANYGVRGRELAEQVRAAMDRMGLPYGEFKDRRTDALSGGEKRSAAIAAVLALKPELLLLDEPSAGLDHAASAVLFEAIAREKDSGTSVIFATHDMRFALTADRIALLSAGKVLADEAPADLFRRSELLNECGIIPPEEFRLINALAAGGVRLQYRPEMSDPAAMATVLADLIPPAAIRGE